jgi:hypothetical protein
MCENGLFLRICILSFLLYMGTKNEEICLYKFVAAGLKKRSEKSYGQKILKKGAKKRENSEKIHRKWRKKNIIKSKK